MGIKGSIMKERAFEDKRRNTLLYAICKATNEAVKIETGLRIKYRDLKEDSYEAVCLMERIKETSELESELSELYIDAKMDTGNRLDQYYQMYMALYTVLQMLAR